jgi:translocation and assembly module TamB
VSDPSHIPLIRRTTLQRILTAVAVGLAVLFFVGLGLLVWALQTGRAVEFARKSIVETLRDRCGVRTEFAELRLDAPGRTMQLSDLRIEDEKGRQLLAVDEALVAVKVFPLLYGRFQLARVALLAPSARLEIRDGVVANLPACVQPEPVTDAAAPPASPISLGVDELTVERGSFEVEVGTAFRGQLEDIGIALVPGPSGGTDLAVGVDDGQIEILGRPLHLVRFRLLGHLAGRLTQPRALVVDALEAALDFGTLRTSGSIDLVGPVADLRVDLDMGLENLPILLPGAPEMSGQASLDLHLTGTPDFPRARGRLETEALRVSKYGPFDRIDIQFAADREEVDLPAFAIGLGPVGGLEGKGRLRLRPGLPTELDVDTRELSLGRVLHSVGVSHPWVDLAATGPTRFTGTLDPVDLAGPFDFRVERFRVTDRPFDDPSLRGGLPAEAVLLRAEPRRVRGRWRYWSQGLRFSDCELLADGTEGRVDATIGFKSFITHEIDATFEPIDMDDVGPIAGVPVRGVGQLQASLRFPPTPDGRRLGGTGILELGGLAVADVPLGDVRSKVDWRQRIVAFEDIRATLVASPYVGRLQLDFDSDLMTEIDVEMPRGRLQDLLLPLRLRAADWGEPEGTASLTGRLRGPFRQLDGPIDLQLEKFRVAGESFVSGRLEGAFERGEVVADSIVFEKPEGRVSARGRLDPATRAFGLSASATIPLSSIDAAQRSAPGLTGWLRAETEVEGRPGHWTGPWSVRLDGLRARELRLDDVRAEGRLVGARTEGELRWGERLRVLADVGLLAGSPVSVRGEVDRVPVFSAWSRAVGASPIEGTVTGSFEVSGRRGRWSRTDGEVRLSSLELAVDQPDLRLPAMRLAQPVVLRLERGALLSDGLDVQGEGFRLAVSGRADPGGLEARVAGTLDLGLLEGLTRGAERADGTFTVDAAVVGPLSRPGLVGTGRLEQGFLQWSGIDDPFSDVSASIDFSRTTILLDDLRARWAGGRVSGQGSVQLGRSRAAMFIDLDSVRPRFALPVADLTGLLSGRLTVTGLRPLRVQGDLQTRRPLVEPRVDVRSLVDGGVVPDAYDPRSEVVEFDIGFDLEEPIRVRGDRIDATVSGDLRFTGSNQRPGLLGAASFAPGGQVNFLGRAYTIQSGVVEFRDRYRVDPSYDFAFGSEACGARIRVSLVGTLQDFDSSYVSTPDMSQRDIVSCLIRGIRIREVDNERAIGAFAGNALLKLSGVDQEVKKVIPVDQIDFTTEFSRQAREYQPRLLVAKELSFFNRSARLEYSSSLVATSDQRAAVRLRLAPRLTLQLGWTSSLDVPLGDWGLDLKHRWEW